MPRMGVMLASPFTERKFNKWMKSDLPMAFLQRKLNGERMKWTRNRLISSEGNLVTGVPHIVAELEENFPNIELDGEAYCHGMSRQIIHGVVSREISLHELYTEVKYHVFDVPLEGEAQYKRIGWLFRNAAHFKAMRYIELVETKRVSTYEDAFAAVNQYVNEGYEGAIFRHPLGLYAPMSRAVMMKWKPKKKDKYEIIEVIEGDGKCAGSVGSFVVKDKEGRTFHVGSLKVDDYTRAALWQRHLEGQLVGEMCWVKYVELSDAGVPPSSVYVAIVGEGDEEDESDSSVLYY